MPKKKVSYKGELNKPILVPDAGEFAMRGNTDMETAKELRKQFVYGQRMQKMALLFQYYGVDFPPDDDEAMLDVLMALAIDHVRGFQAVALTAHKQGRPLKWKGADGAMLYLDVLVVTNQQKISERAACAYLTKQQEYSGMKPEVLHARYQEVKKSPMKDVGLGFLNILMNMIKDGELPEISGTKKKAV